MSEQGETSSPHDASPEEDGDGCFTEAELKRLLPPTPDWMRKPPKRKSKNPSLFDGLELDEAE